MTASGSIFSGSIETISFDSKTAVASLGSSVSVAKLHTLGDAEILIAGSVDGDAAAWYTLYVATSSVKRRG